ncbi:unnamed protein product [Arctia plantaginis]|uniref:Uncharacterized protein n=1 Tax=Arctia plantaginis TaxID=874455 RepID=A0A8S1AJP7_ARCPL|nr:unnamed protein product [Arctia plantaginis]
MGKHWARIVLALVCICVHVGTSQDYVQENMSCVNSTIGHETTNGRLYVYQLQRWTEYFKINVPKCEWGDRIGVSVTVCDTKATTTLELANSDHALIYRTGEIYEPGRAHVVIYCNWIN